MPEKTIRLSVCDNAERSYPIGTAVREALDDCADLPSDVPCIAAFVNNQIRSLSYRLNICARIRPVYLNTSEGMVVYRRSLCYLFAMVAESAFPGHRFLISHSLGNGYFYSVEGTELSDADVQRFEREIRRLVSEDVPINRGVAGYTDALQYFEMRGRHLTALLVQSQNYSEVPVYRCNDFMDISHGPLVNRTGLLRTFSLEKYEDGLLLVFPSVSSPDQALPGERSRLLFETYREHKQWGRILRVSSVGELSQITESGEIADFIRVAEALHNRKIAEIADRILSSGAVEKAIFIAGPSSSGKTTFTKKLAVQLRVLGLIPVMISLDDYFVARDQTPKDESGEFDFENLHAIDIRTLNEHLIRLFRGEEVAIPSFNFKAGVPEYRGNTLKLQPRAVLLMEGIHGLNDELTPDIPRERKFKVYVSALTQLNLDDSNRISTTDNRLIRRIVRDHQFRGHSAATTLGMWPSVRRGENRNIFPYQDSADATFNSALDYELGVLKSYVEPLLRQIKPGDDVYHEAFRLTTFLRNFTRIKDKRVPHDSILREFIGDSGFHY